MAVLPSGNLKSSFASKTTPTGDDFSNLIDSTYGFPTSAVNFSTGLTLTQGATGLPVVINGATYYIPLFTAV
jgi:hypothetical protein